MSEASAEDRAKVIKALKSGNVVMPPNFAAYEFTTNREVVEEAFKNPQFMDLEFQAWGSWEKTKNGEKFGNKGGFSIQWGCKHIGCGSFRVWKDFDYSLHIDTEAMSKEFVKKVIASTISPVCSVCPDAPDDPGDVSNVVMSCHANRVVFSVWKGCADASISIAVCWDHGKLWVIGGNLNDAIEPTLPYAMKIIGALIDKAGET